VVLRLWFRKKRVLACNKVNLRGKNASGFGWVASAVLKKIKARDPPSMHEKIWGRKMGKGQQHK
jgi:hypothetical protein